MSRKPRVTINVAKHFFRTSGPRHRDEGTYSAEEFRDDYLLPAFDLASLLDAELVVELDGGAGYTATFLEEAFGGAVRVLGYRLGAVLWGRLSVVTDQEPYLEEEIFEYMREELQRAQLDRVRYVHSLARKVEGWSPRKRRMTYGQSLYQPRGLRELKERAR